MQTFQIYRNLARLNALSAKKAEEIFLDCSGSPTWARQMAAARPFRLLDELYAAAETLWYSLSTADRLDAFSGHSNGNVAVLKAAKTTAKDLAESRNLYKEKFGFIFVANTDGKTAEEILAICRARIGNSVQTELHIASEEQLKIMEGRLDKLLEK